ncbi:DNA polymerase III subunit beta [Sphingomonas azotifigens]|uniref:DNA polymerase III subunit beta n=1 Tax=Sphingomonas azotifigens TaxID=330920 RepID=UPI0009FDC1AB|nr:DNA polymerase III subunit beta [Sphingomonas azotifigens]
MAAKGTIVFETSELAAAMRDVLGAVQARNTIPILSNVLISATATGHVYLTTTDLDRTVTRACRAKSVSGAVGLTIEAKRLAEVLGTFAAGSETHIEVDGLAAVVKSGRARLRFSVLPADDFPVAVQREVVTSFTISATALARGFNAVRHAVSKEETRYYLCGVFWHVRNGRLLYVATDGHRLARYSDDLPAGAADMRGTILPTLCIDLVRSAAAERGDCDIGVKIGDGKVDFTIGNLVILTKVIDGTYPDYERVIPTQIKLIATVDRDEMIDATRRIMVASSDKVRGGAFTFRPAGVTMSINSTGHGEAVDEVTGDLAGAAEIRIGFNLAYLRDALDVLPVDTVRFAMGAPADPTLITSTVESGLSLVLMPMNV